jgi:glycerol-3-phosphate dehydrogenase
MIPKKADVVIVGAGIVGAMVARELSKYDLDIVVLEKESDICMGQSAANSAIIHSGHDPVPGSLKSRLNIRGNKIWQKIASTLEVPFKMTGSYVVAIGQTELDILRGLHCRAIENGAAGVKMLTREEILYREPKISPQVSGALWTPEAGVVDPFEATMAAAENAVTNGVQFVLDTKVESIDVDGGSVKGIQTDHGYIECKYVINSAGLYADDLIHEVDEFPEFEIKGRRGEYFVFDASKVQLNTVLYPVPTDKGKGTLVSTTTHGNVMIGPNAQFVDDKTASETSRAGLDEIMTNAKKLVPELNERDVIASFAGLRATGNRPNKDFLIEHSKHVGLLHLGGIDSPGFVSAPAIAELVAQMLKDKYDCLTPKSKWIEHRPARPCFRKMSHQERAVLVESNPAYGRIVCRCEEVTEGEILEAIHAPIPARTYDAIKRRTWLGTGRCQGGFDYSRVIELLSRELNISVTEVTKNGEGSEFIYRRTKDVQ